MTLSFLYRALRSVLQLIRISRRKDADPAIEVIIFRREVTVLRRQIPWLPNTPSDEVMRPVGTRG